ADRVLGGGDDRRLRGVGDDDPAPRRRLDVDVVDADAGAADHLETHGPFEQFRGEQRLRADDDRVVVADDRLERAVGVDVDVEARAEQLDAGVGDLLPDEDFHAVVVLCPPPPTAAGSSGRASAASPTTLAASYASSAAVTATP